MMTTRKIADDDDDNNITMMVPFCTTAADSKWSTSAGEGNGGRAELEPESEPEKWYR